MENRLFEESASDNPPKDQKDDPSGSLKSEPQAGPFGESRDQPKKDAPSAGISDNDEFTPAIVKQYTQQEQKSDDHEELEPPSPLSVQKPHDSPLDPEFQEEAKKRGTLRSRLIGLRPNSPDLPLPEPEPYRDPGQQLNDAPDPRQQSANAPTVFPATWKNACLSIYQRMCTFSFQFSFHTLLLTWPLSTAAMGVMNLKVCRIHPILPYVMMVVGIFGMSAILFRLYTLYFEKRVALHIHRTRNYWIGVRTAEFIVWDLFVLQLYYFFEQAPSFTPGTKHYCKWKFYKINCGLMFLTSVTMVGWIAVHVAKFIHGFARRNERANI